MSRLFFFFQAEEVIGVMGVTEVQRCALPNSAAEGVGGDIRGRQWAALVVVRAESAGRPWADRLFDLRVDDHPEPLRELRRVGWKRVGEGSGGGLGGRRII